MMKNVSSVELADNVFRPAIDRTLLNTTLGITALGEVSTQTIAEAGLLALAMEGIAAQAQFRPPLETGLLRDLWLAATAGPIGYVAVPIETLEAILAGNGTPFPADLFAALELAKAAWVKR